MKGKMQYAILIITYRKVFPKSDKLQLPKCIRTEKDQDEGRLEGQMKETCPKLLLHGTAGRTLGSMIVSQYL